MNTCHAPVASAKPRQLLFTINEVATACIPALIKLARHWALGTLALSVSGVGRCRQAHVLQESELSGMLMMRGPSTESYEGTSWTR